MAEVIWRTQTLDDLDRIVDYIEEFDEAAAGGIRRRLIECGESLAVFPRRGRPAAHGHREMTGVPPYILTYSVEDETVFILAIRHGARRPLD